MIELTQARLKELLSYDAGTGILTWMQRRGGLAKVGGIAGTAASRGYLSVQVDGRMYRSHRIIWLYMTGSLPGGQIDHINHDRADNRFSNLREVTNAANHRNLSRRSNNTSSVTGVSWNKRCCKWVSRISINSKDIYLARTTDFLEAICARKSAEIEYGYHANHGS